MSDNVVDCRSTLSELERFLICRSSGDTYSYTGGEKVEFEECNSSAIFRYPSAIPRNRAQFQKVYQIDPCLYFYNKTKRPVLENFGKISKELRQNSRNCSNE